MGLAGSGKTTIAREIYTHLNPNVKNLVYLDGDEFREIFGSNQKYDKSSRIKIAKQKANLCKILLEQNINVICTGISLFKENYEYNRKIIKNYIEIYIECDFDELLKRDQKGLYSGAINQDIKNVVGVDIKFDKPNADLKITNNDKDMIKLNVKNILEYIKANHE